MRYKPFFSVVIPALNEEKYISCILKSLKRQTYRNFELVVVDGGSKDRTEEVYKKNSQGIERRKFIRARANVGFQRNEGARNAAGKYLVFLDADVNVDDTFLEELHIWIIKKNLVFMTTWIKPDSERKFDRFMLLIANLVNELVNGLNKPYTGGYNTIIRKDIFFELGGFRQDLKINEDIDLSLSAYKKGIKCILLKEPVVTFSLRRFRAKGIFPAILNIAKGNILYFTKLNNKVLYEYPMGGQAHEISKPKEDGQKSGGGLK